MVFQVLFDLSKAFDLIDRERAWRAMEKRGASAACLSLLRSTHAGTASRLHDDCGRTVRKVATSLGVRQGSVEGPTVFTVMYDETLQTIQADRNEWLAVFCDPALRTSRIEASMEMQEALGETVFMDDLSQMLVARDESAVEEMIQRTSERLAADGFTVNSGKLEVTAKALGTGERNKNAMIQRGKVTVQAGTKKLKVKKVAKYLGSQMSIDGSVNREIEARTTASRQAHHRLTPRVWRSNALSERIKVRLWRALVQSILLYALEARVLDVGAAERLEKTQIRCLRHLTRQPAHTTHVSSEEIRVRCGVPTWLQKIVQPIFLNSKGQRLLGESRYDPTLAVRSAIFGKFGFEWGDARVDVVLLARGMDGREGSSQIAEASTDPDDNGGGEVLPGPWLEWLARLDRAHFARVLSFSAPEVEKQSQCTVCGRMCAGEKGLKILMSHQHQRKRVCAHMHGSAEHKIEVQRGTCVCPYCGVSYSRPDSLLRHLLCSLAVSRAPNLACTGHDEQQQVSRKRSPKSGIDAVAVEGPSRQARKSRQRRRGQDVGCRIDDGHPHSGSHARGARQHRARAGRQREAPPAQAQNPSQ